MGLVVDGGEWWVEGGWHLQFSSGFIRLFPHILRLGGFHLQGSTRPFFASSGIRQGCPLSEDRVTCGNALGDSPSQGP